MAALAVLLAAPAGAGRRSLQQDMAPTGADPNAKGLALLVLHSDSNGKFDLLVHHLDPQASFTVIVGGVSVGSLTTNHGGNGKARFRSRPGPHGGLLGFDPRGQTVTVRNGDGQDVLQGTLPDPVDPNAVACCLPHHDECESRTADECTQAGGTVSTAPSCLPNPCAPAQSGQVCCISGSADGALLSDEGGDGGGDDASHARCEEDLTQEDCAASGGAVVQATSCDPNPCTAPAPPTTVTACCVPDDGGAECEVFSPDRCTARGGTAASGTSCEPDPCGGGTGHHGGRHGD